MVLVNSSLTQLDAEGSIVILRPESGGTSLAAGGWEGGMGFNGKKDQASRSRSSCAQHHMPVTSVVTLL